MPVFFSAARQLPVADLAASRTAFRTPPGALVSRSLAPRVTDPRSMAPRGQAPHFRACLLPVVLTALPPKSITQRQASRFLPAMATGVPVPQVPASSPAGPGLGLSSLNSLGSSPHGVNRIDAPWETLVIHSSNSGDCSACGKHFDNSHLDGDSCPGAGKSPATPAPTAGTLLVLALLAVTAVPSQMSPRSPR